jgi:mRNA guanylyltransferase
MRFRDDKNEPNYVSVVDKIMQSIQEGVQLNALTDARFLKQVESNWRKRQHSQH